MDNKSDLLMPLWNTHEAYLVVFTAVQDLVGIHELVLLI